MCSLVLNLSRTLLRSYLRFVELFSLYGIHTDLSLLQYDFADGTMRPPQSIQVGPQMRPEANANTPWYPHGMPMVNVDSDFSLGSELGMSDFSNLDDGVTLSLFDAGYYRYPSGGPIGGFGLGPGASNFDDGATPPLHNTDEYFDFGAFPS
ncbi:uncharacterized protein BT62DRAFT_52492 [Guyanagaster necrorhizus]|uniref:Uncharacterized protein n=1 Tax=Guyanagaster necrorhizus TaxID=856835 RepID=A0A9P7W6L0_9AGAR|nr:uncharacterized protein BT62DRAFT_52492 [Guyanagaster necrorhizus MCA 3950]KAG7453224.1 hypothetical protein BT62DRAFT_52492 [Guyanagaster necrorhizus MCA 3950]